jgi:hypothetical protein
MKYWMIPKFAVRVKCQVLPKYRERLSNYLDPSTKERQGEEWFDQKWSDEDWRIRNCPGKEVLKRLRTWCQKNYSLTLTDPKLAMALQQCPDDLREIIGKLQEYLLQCDHSRMNGFCVGIRIYEASGALLPPHSAFSAF